MGNLRVQGNPSGSGTHTLQGTSSNSSRTATLPDGDETLGYINAPQNSQTGATYTLVLTDQGDHIYFTGGTTATLTVPLNSAVAFPIGTAILVLNNNSGSLTISSSATLQLAAGSTGNRTVASKGMASLLKVATDTWWVSGAGVT